MGNNNITITNIQRFSIHDGPGIRTTVFLKGCTLHCPWCCNPENISPSFQTYHKDGYAGVYGENISCEELYKKIIKDKTFYGDFKYKSRDLNIDDLRSLPGGITFSGGEPLIQFGKLIPLLKKLKNEDVHMAVETSLFVPLEQLMIALEYVDLFYVDIKILDYKKCDSILGGDLDTYLKNIDILFSWRDNNNNCGKPVVFRIPLIGGYTALETNRELIIDLIKRYKPLKIELIKEHNLGASKYISLDMQVPSYKGVDNKMVEDYKAEIEKAGIPVEICNV